MVLEEVEAVTMVLTEGHLLLEKEEFPDHVKDGLVREDDLGKEVVCDEDLL